MAISESLSRRIRARRDDEEDEDAFLSGSSSNEEVEGPEDDFMREGASGESDEEEDPSDGDTDAEEEKEEEESGEEEDEEEASDDNEAVQSQLRQISFGALAKAQDSIGRKRKRPGDSSTDKITSNDNTPSTLDDIRERLRKAREQKQEQSESKSKNGETTKPSRSSKHAPAVQSSKHAVSRKRIVIEPPNAIKARDPRFDPTVIGSRPSAAATNNAYSFLDEYRSSEIKQLQEQLTRTKDPALKEKLKRAVTSASDRQRALEYRKREQEVLSEHKKKERQLLREGKKSKPYFLKKSELKREVLKKKYESMGSKQRTKALERRRKKVASKEKKDLPWSRRGLENTD